MATALRHRDSAQQLYGPGIFFSSAKTSNGVRFFRCGDKWPYAENLTRDFVYCRLHGAEELYASGYTDSALDKWAARIRKWRIGQQPRNACLVSSRKQTWPGRRDIYVYFDNDAKVHAPFDAKRLARRLRLT